ncbi:MAG: hypothetical protein SWH68_09665 [Thermodesulfobacteriota bacterium]|nr:hypothetical protein [Thermodesulfobacteriota bacterium]
MDVQINEAVALQENTSSFRKSLFKNLADLGKATAFYEAVPGAPPNTSSERILK